MAARRAGAGPILGAGLMEFPLLDNPHSVEIMLAVHPDHRRRGAGTAIVEEMVDAPRPTAGASLNSIVDVPLSMADDDPSLPFAHKVGFEATLPATRALAVPDRRRPGSTNCAGWSPARGTPPTTAR